jgi:hypothetical protein
VRKWNRYYGMYLDWRGHSYWAMGNLGHKDKPENCTVINRKTIDPNDVNCEYTKEDYIKYCEEEDKPKEQTKLEKWNG